MCCLMCLCKPKCVKVSLFITSLLLVLCAGFSIFFAFVAKENTIYGIIGEIGDFDLQMFVFVFCLVCGIICLFLLACGIGTSIKRFCFCHWLFAIILSFFTIFFIALGIALISIALVSSDELEKLCSDDNSDSDFQKALNDIYENADEIFCVPGAFGCVCDTGNYAPPSKLPTGYANGDIVSGTVQKVQECTDHLERAYEDYNVDFDDINDIIEYLNYFGEIETDYECSGVCAKRDVYYFSDSSLGAPPDRCYESIDEDMLKGEILPMGIGYAIIGAFIFIITFVQYGLCCRENLNERENRYKGQRRYEGQQTDNPVKNVHNPYI